MAGVSGRTCALLAIAAFVLSAAGIASTYRVFNDTIDENDHIEAGIEYWQLGRYEYETQHPPLARLAVSVLPYFLTDLRLDERRVRFGERYTKPVEERRLEFESFFWAGAWHEATPDFYWRTLSLARAGNLLFWAFLLGVVFLWARDLLGDTAALAATLLAAFSPNLLGHAGLATLDLAAAATALASAYAFDCWARAGGRRNALLAGVAAGLAIGAKFSLLAFVPPAWAASLWVRRDQWKNRQGLRRFARGGAVVAIAAAITLWGLYGFDTGPIPIEGDIYISPQEQEGFPEPLARAAAALIGSTPVPAPGLIRGVLDVLAHNAAGHATYLFGEWSPDGQLLYFPAAIGVKSTLPLLALSLWGAALAWHTPAEERRRLAPVLALFSITLLVSVTADINIGIRHILPLYPCLAILGAIPFRDWKPRSGRATQVAAALLLWHGGEAVWAHPDHLPYFNEVARGREEKFLLDSNLDWGQDLARLDQWMDATGTPAVILRYFGETWPGTVGVNNYILPAAHPDAGWFAISANLLFGMEGSSPQLRALAAQPPAARVGKSLWVYRINPRDIPLLTPPWFLERYHATPPPEGRR